MNQRYDKVRVLGSGNFGQAWLVTSRQSGRQYVVKEMRMTVGLSKQDRDRTFTEVSIIKSCCHVNIIRYKEFFITNDTDDPPRTGRVPVISIVMEYADDGDLHQAIKRRREKGLDYFPEGTVRNYFVQVTLALQYLHRHNILHRDLKSQNIFMTRSGLLKLGDFGISRTLSHDNDFATTGIGTPQYLSPEICRQQKYDYKSDIWSLGCVLYEMCALRPAFPGNDWADLFQNILRARYAPIPTPQFSNHLCELVKVMLRPEPNRRPSASQLVGATILQTDLNSYLTYISSLPEMGSGGDVLSSASSASGGGLSGSESSLGSGSELHKKLPKF